MTQAQRLTCLGLLALSAVLMIISPLLHWLDFGYVLHQFGAPRSYLRGRTQGLHYADGKWVLGAGAAVAVVCIFTVVEPRLGVLAALPAAIVAWAVSHFLSMSIGDLTVWPGVARIAAFVAAIVGGLLWPSGGRTRAAVAAVAVAVVVIGLVVGDIVGGPSDGHAPIVNAIFAAAW